MFYTESTMQSSQEQKIFLQKVFLQRTTSRKNQKLSRKSSYINNYNVHNCLCNSRNKMHGLRENLKRRTFTPSKSQMEHFFEFSISRQCHVNITYTKTKLAMFFTESTCNPHNSQVTRTNFLARGTTKNPAV